MKVFPKAFNTIQMSVSGYFLVEEIVNYFEVKKRFLKYLAVQKLEAVIDF